MQITTNIRITKGYGTFAKLFQIGRQVNGRLVIYFPWFKGSRAAIWF